MTETNKAYLFAESEPSEVQKNSLHKFIKETVGTDLEIVWEKSDKYACGFALNIG